MAIQHSPVLHHLGKLSLSPLWRSPNSSCGLTFLCRPCQSNPRRAAQQALLHFTDPIALSDLLFCQLSQSCSNHFLLQMEPRPQRVSESNWNALVFTDCCKENPSQSGNNNSLNHYSCYKALPASGLHPPLALVLWMQPEIALTVQKALQCSSGWQMHAQSQCFSTRYFCTII